MRRCYAKQQVALGSFLSAEELPVALELEHFHHHLLRQRHVNE